MKFMLSLAAMAASSALALTAVAQGLTDDIFFNIANNTEATISGLYLTRSDDPKWGDDITAYIGPGETMEVAITDNLPDCYYDLAIEFSDRHALAYGEVNVCELGGETLAVN
jgi:hypothetical protein